MNNNARKIIIVILAILSLSIITSYYSGTSIVINGKPITGVGGFISAYLGLILLAVILIVVIPSALLLILILAILFGMFFMLFFPLLPIAFLLLPGFIFAGIVYFIYKLVKRRR
ncbi:MAG: hypothetical protein ABSB95_10195 [Dissulfurispiraceae bacterium]|jgi:hypothetical protein